MHLLRDLLFSAVFLLLACVERTPPQTDRRTATRKAVTSPVRKPSPPPRVMQIVASRCARPPTIDGRFRDAVWGGAASDPLRTISGAAAQRTTVRVAWSEAGLYLGFESEDAEILSTITGCASAPGSGDAVGVLFQIGEERIDLVLSPCGTLCVRRGTSVGARWNEGKELKAAVAIDGTLNGGDRDRSWTGELAIPWPFLRGRGTPPPAPGETIRINFYRIEAPGKSPTIAWSPRESLLPDGELQLGDERGSSVEPPSQPKPKR